MTDFPAFPKIPRLSRDVTITEKLDGTNASVLIEARSKFVMGHPVDGYYHHGMYDAHTLTSDHVVSAGSRTKWITPKQDNYGFARWVWDNAQELANALGEGHHFGEWWGRGIQRNYSQTERHFSLFNTKRWGYHFDDQGRVGPCRVVPTLYRGPLESYGVMKGVQESLRKLSLGSVAAPGFTKPEGIIIFHEASQQMYKKTLDKDDEPKGKSQ